MDWDTIITMIIGLLAVVGLPLAFRSRKKGGQSKAEELSQHLQKLGVQASRLEEGIIQGKVGGKRSSGHKPVGIITLTSGVGIGGIF